MALLESGDVNDVQCSGSELKEIANDLGKDWILIAKQLGLDKNDISKIEESGSESVFDDIVNFWKRRNSDNPLTYGTLEAKFCNSTQFSQDEVKDVISKVSSGKKAQISIENRVPQDVEADIDEELLQQADEGLMHPNCSLNPIDAISVQFDSLLKALITCIINHDIDLEVFKSFVMSIQGSKRHNSLFVHHIDKVANLPSIDSAFQFLTQFLSSVDVELLEGMLKEFPCEICIVNLDTYKENLKKSRCSMHTLRELEPGMTFVTCVFREVADSSDPLCKDIIAKKSFCLAFGIEPGALRLLEHEYKAGVILKWQVFPDIIDMFTEELSDRSLEMLVPLKLKSLKVENVLMYFYLKNITEGAQPQASPLLQPGDTVLIKSETPADALKLQEGHGGWNVDMTEILGKEAYVLQIDSDKDALLYIPAVRRKYVLNPELLEKNVDDSGKSGTELCASVELPKFEVGDAVVLCDLHKLIALQSKHNGITDDMCQNAGDIAFVVHIHDREYVRADMLPMRRTFHPCALLKVPKDRKDVQEGIQFLKGKVDSESAIMECVKKAQSNESDLHNLLLAILFHNEALFCDYIKKHKDKINTSIYKKHTALHLATLTGNRKFVHILLDNDAKPELKNDQGFASLHFATMSKFKDIAELLLTWKGGNINLQTIGGFTPLMIAATNNEHDIVEFLCKFKCHGSPSLDLDIKNAEGGTALHHAVQNNAQETVKILIDNGADPTIPNHLGHNCFHVAAINGKASVMERLVTSYPQFAKYGDLKDITPLHWACYHGNFKVAQLLLNKTDIDIDTRDSTGGTPLFTAAMEGHTNIIHLLIQYGADPNSQRLDKDTPLHAIVRYQGRFDSIKAVESTELQKIKDNLPDSTSAKLIVACFLAKEGAVLDKPGRNDKSPVEMIDNETDVEMIKSFCKDSSEFRGSMKRCSIAPPPQIRHLWVEKRVAEEPRTCGHLFCKEHVNRVKKCPRCSRKLEPLKDLKQNHGRVCPACLKSDINPLKSFGDMINIPNDSDDEGEDNNNFQQTLREMTANAAAEVDACRQQ